MERDMAVQVAPLVVAPPSFVEVNGHRIAYDEAAPPNPKGTVLLLTGLASKRLGWQMQLQPFGQVYRTIAMDHRDSGDSFYADTPYMTADQAEDVAGLLSALGITPTPVVRPSLCGVTSPGP